MPRTFLYSIDSVACCWRRVGLVPLGFLGARTGPHAIARLSISSRGAGFALSSAHAATLTAF